MSGLPAPDGEPKQFIPKVNLTVSYGPSCQHREFGVQVMTVELFGRGYLLVRGVHEYVTPADFERTIDLATVQWWETEVCQ